MSDKREPCCESLLDFLAVVKHIESEWCDGEPSYSPFALQLWFRGQRDVSWPLKPSYFRLPQFIDDPDVGIHAVRSPDEFGLVYKFRLRAPRYLSTLPQNDWEWLFLMQHYGLPTRLLDWTESALFALYFALRNHNRDCDAVVWVLDPMWLNKQIKIYNVPSTADSVVVPWCPGSLQAEMPLAIQPIHASTRIAAQRGVFTIHGRLADGFEKLGRAAEEARLVPIRICSDHTVAVLDELRKAGIDQTTVFPGELESLCEELKRDLIFKSWG